MGLTLDADAGLFGRCVQGWWHFYVHERRMLLAAAQLPEDLHELPWHELDGEARDRLLFAMRQAIALGDSCRRVLNEHARPVALR